MLVSMDESFARTQRYHRYSDIARVNKSIDSSAEIPSFADS